MKWAIREAVDVYFKAKSPLKLGARTIRAGEPIMIFDTVQTSALEVAAEISYVTGGRGNARILSFEGDKTLTFNFEDALLSNEGLAILSGADLIPARNSRLSYSSPDARAVTAHFTEKFVTTISNRPDPNLTNTFPASVPDPETDSGYRPPIGGTENVSLSKKPFVGTNGTIYVMLLDAGGEMSGAPIEISLTNPDRVNGRDGNGRQITEQSEIDRRTYLARFAPTDDFIAIDNNNNPIPRPGTPAGMAENARPEPNPTNRHQSAIFDDRTAHYADYRSFTVDNINGFALEDFRRTVGTPTAGSEWGDGPSFSYLVGEPRAFNAGASYVYRVNVPSVLQDDIVLIDYYVEHRRGATQVSILPDKFGPFVYVEGSSLVRRASDGRDLPAEFVIPKFKITTQLTFTMASTGDASTFNFAGDAYPDFSKFDRTRRVLADIQIIDDTITEPAIDPTDYRRFHNSNTDVDYLWKDPSLQPHSNIDMADTGTYEAGDGGPVTITPGDGALTRGADNGGGSDPQVPARGIAAVEPVLEVELEDGAVELAVNLTPNNAFLLPEFTIEWGITSGYAFGNLEDTEGAAVTLNVTDVGEIEVEARLVFAEAVIDRATFAIEVVDTPAQP